MQSKETLMQAQRSLMGETLVPRSYNHCAYSLERRSDWKERGIGEAKTSFYVHLRLESFSFKEKLIKWGKQRNDIGFC